MGEAAEMVLDGILDWDGSYSGNGYGVGKSNPDPAAFNAVGSFFKSIGLGGDCFSKNYDKRGTLMTGFAELKELKNKSYTSTVIYIRANKSNWSEFKTFVRENYQRNNHE